MEERWYLAALLQCRQIGSVRMRRLCDAVSDVRTIWSMNAAELRETGALTDTVADALARHSAMHPDLPAQIQEDCTRLDIALITMDDADYPVVLREIFDPPLVLY